MAPEPHRPADLLPPTLLPRHHRHDPFDELGGDRHRAAPERRDAPAALVPRQAAPRRRDLRLTARAAEIIRRDKRRRWVAGATLLVVGGTVVVPSILLNGTANAAGVTQGTMTLAAGKSATADSAVKVTDGSGRATFVLPGRPQGGSLYFGVELRRSGAHAYRVKVRAFPDGSLTVGLSRVVNNAETSLGSTPVPAKVGTGATSIDVQGSISDSTPARLGARVWVTGETAPRYQFRAKDSTPLIATGTVRAWSYLSASATAPLTLGFDRLSGLTAGPVTSTPAESETLAPKPTPTSTPSGTATTKPKPSATAKPPSAPVPAPPPAEKPKPGGSPGAGNTGVPAGTKLTRHDGNLVLDQAGRTYTNLDVHGFVDVRAPNVTLKDSIVRGGTATTSRGIVTNTAGNGTGFVIEDTTLVPAHPNVYLEGLKGGNFTARRVDISGVVDGVKIHGNAVRLESSWVHDLRDYASDPYQGGGASHNDAVQVVGGTDVVIKGNRLEDGSNAALQVTQDYAPTVGLVFQGNWAGGGECTLNLHHKDRSSMGPVVIKDNVFLGTSSRAGCAITRTGATVVQLSGNSFAAGGAATARVNG